MQHLWRAFCCAIFSISNIHGSVLSWYLPKGCFLITASGDSFSVVSFAVLPGVLFSLLRASFYSGVVAAFQNGGLVHPFAMCC